VDKNGRSTIKLNGQVYSNLTNRSLAKPRPKNIDGIVSSSTIQKNYTMPPRQPERSLRQPSIAHPIHNLPKKTVPAQTLMRTAVKKPAKSSRPISKANGLLGPVQSDMIKTPVMINSIDPRLARRARSFRLNDKVSRYGGTLRTSDRPIQPLINRAASPAPVPTTPPPKKDMFERAIDQATSHQQPQLTKKELKALHGKRPRKTRFFTLSAIGLLFIGIIGYGIYQNIPNFMVKVASVRAGISAHMPDYKPSGFTLANVGYQPGAVQLNFKSNIGNRVYSITEHSSNWNSNTLVSNIVIPTEGTNYKQLNVNGINIFLYGNDQAAWVLNGIWYQIKGNNSLSTNQIVQMATTL